ncbi:MAG: hypothetical protein NTV30_06615, partial [Chloroflexi bacterium]|nr:hypothetical protein [Chloroflexota bacterium]
ERIYKPLSREEGVGWKELLAGINKNMQTYCGDTKREALLNLGLTFMEDLYNVINSRVFATDPHSLGNLLGIVDVLTAGEMIMHASLARKASSVYLAFKRAEYPQMDPPEWHKFVTIRMENNKVKVGERPIDYGIPFEKNYKAHSGL